MATYTYTSSGNYIAPSNITKIQIECWGGGAGGGPHNSGLDSEAGGGGGAYAKKNSYSVTGGNTYPYVVGTGGGSGQNGGDTYFHTNVCLAKAGLAGVHNSSTGLGGLASNCIGDIKYNGGNGGNVTGENQPGGGGGGSAGTEGPGNNGQQPAGAVAVTGGGTGGDGSAVGVMVGGNASGVGSGGGGVCSWGYGGTGGSGTAGKIVLTEIESYAIVTTQAVDQNSYNTVRGNGNVTDIGMPAITRRGFCYVESKTATPTVSDSVIYEDGTFTTGAYSLTISNLKTATFYRVRAYVVNETGIAYGTTVLCSTIQGTPPVVTTLESTRFIESLKLNGEIISQGGISQTTGFLFKEATSGDLNVNTIRVLIVAGGGAGAGATVNNGDVVWTGGAGGGGGVIYNENFKVLAGDYSVVVGDGGVRDEDSGIGTDGEDSSFATLLAKGGGAGGISSIGNSGSSGGSGGGLGGKGVSGQGSDGASSGNTGGGGNTQVPTNETGGIGYIPKIGNALISLAGGGGGGYASWQTVDTGGRQGKDGGSNSASGFIPTDAPNAEDNRGGGGGGGYAAYWGTGQSAYGSKGGNGGSGIVVIQYDPDKFGDCTGGTIVEPGTVISKTFTYGGNDTLSFVCPLGVTDVTIECWGGGGAGSTRTTNGGGAGGGGGAYARSEVTLIPGQTYSFTIGGQGEATQFNSNQVKAAPGQSLGSNVTTGGLGGQVADSIGDVIYAGGNGADGGGSGSNGGGGGESAGASSAGNNASGSTGGTGLDDGGDGGNGATSQGNGSSGSAPGGGGGGGKRTSSGTRYGGAGAPGQIKISYTTVERYHIFTEDDTFSVVDPIYSESEIITVEDKEIGTFLETLNELTSNTEYRIRAFAINQAGIGLGDTITSMTREELSSGFLQILLN